METKYEWYDTKYALAETILPLLIRYKDNYSTDGVALPNWLENKSTNEDVLIGEWIVELNKMINAFEMILAYRNENQNIENQLEYENVIQHGLESFAKYFQHFWD